MASKRRCSFCRDYFKAEELIATGVGGVCSTECLNSLKDKYRAKRKRRQYHRENRHRFGRRLAGQVRDKVRKRDGSACRYCGKAQGRLEIHHIQYRSQGGTDILDNLITLCAEHHLLMHSNKRRWQRALQMTLWIGAVEGRFLTVPEVERRFSKIFAAEDWNDPYGESAS